MLDEVMCVVVCAGVLGAPLCGDAAVVVTPLCPPVVLLFAVGAGFSGSYDAPMMANFSIAR